MPVTPHMAATDVLDRADQLLTLDAPSLATGLRTDVRRLAWAMGVASIDTYLHWLVRSVDLDSTLPRDLSKLDVPFEALVEMGRSSVQARREGRADRPMIRARNALHKRILQDTYQSARKVEQALSLAGVPRMWASLGTEMGEPAADIKAHLNSLAVRRNAVVHEGDIERQSRPRAIRRQELSAPDVRAELDWARRFVDALGRVAP
ncbi:hypothetical protein [Agromyces lapidis]|uniref:RiboL-PSP-HEPN domain-containing protein n=1 Tax=Agromyces lapidis TaxID=279574 RepID=A0ABV5SYG4_9MICO|nr:hypothetical protein [Agromyces lapidis]